jgi:hypothetical protein
MGGKRTSPLHSRWRTNSEGHAHEYRVSAGGICQSFCERGAAGHPRLPKRKELVALEEFAEERRRFIRETTLKSLGYFAS